MFKTRSNKTGRVTAIRHTCLLCNQDNIIRYLDDNIRPELACKRRCWDCMQELPDILPIIFDTEYRRDYHRTGVLPYKVIKC